MPAVDSPAPAAAAKPVIDGQRGTAEQVSVYAFVILPLLALLAAVPFAWGWGLGWTDVVLAAVFYVISGLGITVGFHRYFTHGSFKANRPLRIGLGVAGSLAFQGPVTVWVADHRRHHAFSDAEGDPHSPWLFGQGPRALAKGFWHSHTGWLFTRDMTNRERFTPDLLADRDIVRVDHLFILWSTLSLVVPAILGGLITWSFWGALTALFWAGLVPQRVAAGRAQLRRVLAQPAPRRPHLRPARRAARPGRHLRAGDLGVREARLGALGALAHRPAAGEARPRQGRCLTLRDPRSNPDWRQPSR